MTAYLTATCAECANLDRTQGDGPADGHRTYQCRATPARHHQRPENRSCADFVALVQEADGDE